MKRRPAKLEPFGLSFLDVLSCALGGVLLLLLLTVNRQAEDVAAAEARARSLVSLIGLKGDMHGVVLVFDTSGSMAGARFDEYSAFLQAWVMDVEFERFNVMEFNTKVNPWKPTVVPATPANRQAAAEFVRGFQAAGATSTLAAFQEAFKDPQVTTIVFFSDGDPTDATTHEILAWLEREQADRKVTINTVGMGNYFNQAFGQFLKDIADRHGGVFIGR